MKMINMEENIIVETSHGKVRGYARRGVIKFKGIPYAASPVDNLRFKPPAPVEPWNDVFDATNFIHMTAILTSEYDMK